FSLRIRAASINRNRAWPESQTLDNRNVLPFLLLLAATAGPDRMIAPAWSAPESSNYQAGVDRKVIHGGTASLFLKSLAPDSQGYAVRQGIRAETYRGK